MKEVYLLLKHNSNKKDEFYYAYYQLCQIEFYLKSLGLSEKEIVLYITEPLDFLFGKSVIEVIMINKGNDIISFLEEKLDIPREQL